MPSRGQGLTAVKDADVVETEEATLEDVLAVAVLAVDPPGEVGQELAEGALQEVDIALAAQGLLGAVEKERRPRVDGRVDVAEVPLIGRDLATRVQVDLAQQQLELLLR